MTTPEQKKRYWGMISPQMPANVLAQVAKQQEDLGFEGTWAAQVFGPPFSPLAAAATSPAAGYTRDDVPMLRKTSARAASDARIWACAGIAWPNQTTPGRRREPQSAHEGGMTGSGTRLSSNRVPQPAIHSSSQIEP